jgi:hypothetical protein
MKKGLIYLVVLGVTFGISGLAMASNTAQQIVVIAVDPINVISVSGNPPVMILNIANIGTNLAEIQDASTTYNITTNGTAMKITGRLDSAMPTGVQLKINLVGSVSSGDVVLTTSATDLVTGITRKAEKFKTITYKLSAISAGITAPRQVTITLELVSEANNLILPSIAKIFVNFQIVKQ